MTFCRAVNSGATEDTWKVRASPSLARATMSRRSMSRPAKRMEPLSCRTSPATCLMTVDLPAPFGPISAWISPGRKSSVTSSLATTAPKRLERL